MTQFPVITTSAIGEDTIPTVNARDLHAFLENGDHFSSWIRDRIKQYSFVQGVDFTTYSENTEKGAPRIEYAVSIDMAKELAMVERNEKGKQARQYFIECERRAKGENVHFLVPQTLPEALRLAADLAEKVEEQKTQIADLTPKAEFHDKVAQAINCQTIKEVAKVLGTGEKRMFAWLRDHKILMLNNQPYQRFIDSLHFRMVQKQYTDIRGESHTYTQTLVTGKGLAYIQSRFAEAA